MTPPPPHVFVVDDEALIATTLGMILRQCGLRARSFTKPLDALQAARFDAPDLLVSDVRMPLLTGIELATKLRRHCPDCKVLLYSGYASNAHLLEAAQATGHNFEILAKSAHPADLLARIRNLTEPYQPHPTAEKFSSQTSGRPSQNWLHK